MVSGKEGGNLLCNLKKALGSKGIIAMRKRGNYYNSLTRTAGEIPEGIAVPVTKIKEQQYTMNEVASKIIEALFATFVQTTIHEI